MRTHLALTLVFAVTIAAGCSKSPTPAAAAGAPQKSSGSAAPAAAPGAAVADTETITGTVAETMNAGGYTYMRLQTGSKDVWAAAPETTVKVGEHLTASISMPMENFRSKTLNRDFPVIYFVSAVARDGEKLAAGDAPSAPALAGSHDSSPSSTADSQVNERIPPAAGGMTIADVWAKRKSLAGKAVIVRGKVVKVNNAIMGKNWFHIQDGSGSAKDGTHELTITTSATVKLGDIVTVSGALTIDKDFGAGYSYDAIIEDAKVTDVGKSADR